MDFHHCRTLESILCLTALRTVWAARWGSLFSAFHILCLEDDPRKVTTVQCTNNPPCACYHYVILRHDQTGAVGACHCEPSTCPDIKLTIPEITPLRVNRARLGHAIARAMECQPAHADLGIPNTRQIGTWSSAAVPVLFTIQNEPYQLTAVAARLVAKLRQKFILITPTTHLVTAPCQEHLASVGAAIFDMASNLALTEKGILQPLRPPAELFAPFSPESERPSSRSTLHAPRYALRKGLGVWELYFDGQRAILKHERGLFYVHWLLYHPDETPIHAIDLMAKVPEIYRQQLGLPTLVNQSTGKSVDLESHARLQERSLALDDRQAMRAIFKKEKELEAILDSDATEPEKAEALRELEQIIEFQKRHARRSADTARITTHAVRQSIKRFHHRVAQTNGTNASAQAMLIQFAAHLQHHLLTPSHRTSPHASLLYHPAHAVTWSP